MGAVTDPDAAIGTDEHVPVFDSKTEYSISVICPVVLEQAVESVGVNEIIQWWELERANPGCFCQGFDDDFRWRSITFRAIRGINDWPATTIECEVSLVHIAHSVLGYH